MQGYKKEISLQGDEAVFWQMLREFIQREQALDEAVEYYLDNNLDQKMADWMADNLADEIRDRLTVTLEVD